MSILADGSGTNQIRGRRINPFDCGVLYGRSLQGTSARFYLGTNEIQHGYGKNDHCSHENCNASLLWHRVPLVYDGAFMTLTRLS